MRKQNGKRLLNLLLSLVLAASLGLFLVCCGPTTTSEPTESGSQSVESEESVIPTPVECTITFETGDGSAIDEIVVMSGEYAEKPENPTLAGHTFKGWYLDLNDLEAGSFMFDETPIESDITLYALWQIRQYNVSFQDPDGNPIQGLEGGIANWGTLIEEPDVSAIAKEGYLVKWYTSGGEIWDFATSKVVSNTVLTYRYVATKDVYLAADMAENFYPSYDRGDYDPTKSAKHYTEGAETIHFTYDGGGSALQQIFVSLELSTLDYGSVTVVLRATSFAKDEEGNYTFDAANAGVFSLFRSYILTDLGGHLHYNDKGASGYDPVNYFIQSTSVNKELFSQQVLEDGYLAVTFDLASLKFWNEASKVYGFALGFVCTSHAVEVKSVVFNKVDKSQTYEVTFTDRLGNELADTQTIAWNSLATKPEQLADADGRTYTGEWLDASGEVFDFTKRIRGNVALYPEYTVTGKYSWTGEEIGVDYQAVYNTDKTLPATEGKHNGNTVFTFNNGSGNALRQVVLENVELAIGDYKYLTFKWRVVNYSDFAYNPSGAFALIRIYLVTDLGGSLTNKDVADAESFYINFNKFSTSEVTTPVDMTAKLEDGWYVVSVDLNHFAYYANGTTLKGLAIGTTIGAGNAIELSEITISEELAQAGASHTVTYLSEDGEAIDGLDPQVVPFGKAASMPSADLVPAKEDYAFAGWVDADGNAFTFGTILTEDVVLYASYTNSWVGQNYTLTGQAIVDAFTTSGERYGTALAKKYDFGSLSLDADGNASFDYTPFNKPNMVINNLNAGIKIHEGSKLVVKYKSSTFSTYTVNRLNLAYSFRGQDPATYIHGDKAGSNYAQYKDIAFGTTSGTGAEDRVSFVVAEDGTVTVTFDLYKIQQMYLALGLNEEGVNADYMDAFSFMIVETNSGTGAKTSNATITYLSVEYQDVILAPLAE